MKKQTLILAILMVLSVPAFTQWYQIYGSYPSIRKVFTLDKDHAYIVGHMGSFSRTTDGGNNWVDISTNCLEELLDVQFLNPSTGYICGSGGTLMKTIDGGDNWTFCNTGTVKEIISLRFSDEMNGFLSVRTGQNTGNIFRTTDGGITFTQCSVPLAEFLSISLIGNDTCFVSATGSFGNKVFRTYDGGTTWNEVFFSSINSFRVLKSFPNGKIYACAFSERMYFSNDFGNSWDSLLYQEENQMCLDASFPTSDIIFTAGFDPVQSAGYLYYSQNEGQTWSYNLFDPSLCTVSVIIDDAHDTVGFAGSQGGNLYRLSVISGLSGPKNQEITVAPVPFCDHITIDMGNKIGGGGSAILYSSTGNKIIEKDFIHHVILNVPGSIPSGLYLLHLKQNGRIVYQQKVVKIQGS